MVTLRPSLSRSEAEEGAANQKLQAFLGTHSYPPRVGGGQEVRGRGGAWAAEAHSAAQALAAGLMCWGGAGTLPELAMQGPALQRPVPSLLEGASSSRIGPSRGVQDLVGIPGCRPSCDFSLDEVAQAGRPSTQLTREIWGLGSLLWDPQEVLSSHFQSPFLGSL